MKAPSLDAAFRVLFTPLMLADQPEGTVLHYGWDVATDRYVFYLRTQHVVTCAAIRWRDLEAGEGAFIRLLRERLVWVARTHELGYNYNVWPGWRV